MGGSTGASQLASTWGRWRDCLKTLARESQGAGDSSGGSGQHLAAAAVELCPLLDPGVGSPQAVWDAVSRWVVVPRLVCSSCRRPTLHSCPQICAPPACPPASSFPEVALDATLLAETARQQPQMRAAALAAIKPLAMLAALPGTPGCPLEHRRSMLASGAYLTLVRLFLHGAPPALQRLVRAAAQVPGASAAEQQQDAHRRTAAAGAGPAGTQRDFAEALGGLLAHGAAGLLEPRVVGALPAEEEVKEVVCKWLRVLEGASRAGVQGRLLLPEGEGGRGVFGV